ncbi:hypothetical protein, partial [Microcystis sp. M049S1]|uniref:hypothetical protein n=1 Tax=Microcystis sp. M049S1 TaxID=2771120 RepID=UPI002584260D
LRGFNENMQGTPEQVIPNLTQVDDEGNPMPQAIKPAQPQNIPAAFRALSTSPDAAMRQFAQQGAMQFAQKAAERAEVARTVEITGANGEKLIQQLDKAGQPVGAPMPAYNAPMQINTGGAIELVAPKAGQRFAVGMSPSERDASARGWANVRQGQERLEIDKTKTTPNANVTEGERKAATLLQRMQNSEAQLLKALEGKKSAEKPGIVPSLFRGVGLETMANLVTPENRQQAEAAQLDILDAALTLGTGAAYTKEQLEGYRKSYFPQIGDRPETIRDKQARLNNVLSAARIAAGRSAGQVIAPQQPAEMPPGFEVIR